MLSKIHTPILALLACYGINAASGVIVAGSSGTGNNNATEAGLGSYLAGASLDPFPYWDNLVRVSNASGVYLGFNPTTQRGWVLSADHIGPEPTSISVAGNSYSVSSTVTKIGMSDLTLYAIGGGMSDPALPGLAAIPLSAIFAANGETALMFGRGFTTATSGPYPWSNPGTTDANGMRWGSNIIEGTVGVNLGTIPSPNIQPYTYVDFDGSATPGATPFDAQGSVGDSGGGLFVLRSGVWQLTGIAHFVDDGPEFLELVASGDNIVDPSQTGDFTAYSDVASKRFTIGSVTGNLIPEPSSLLVCLSSVSLLLRRRR